MIIYQKGDLFTSQAPILAHGCNTQGKMGAGIAKEFKARYFEMFKQYRNLCGEAKFNVGEGFVFKTSDNKYIFNLATQASLSGATTDFIESAFKWMRSKMFELEIFHAAMPRIGCGLGGLEWVRDVEPILIEYFVDIPFIIEVWEAD